MIKPELIQRKIALIQDDLIKLAQLSNYTLQEIVKDFTKQAAVERILERIISRAIDINEHIIAEQSDNTLASPKTYRDTFLALAQLEIYSEEFAATIAKSVGTRNLLVHEYDTIDYEKVYASMNDCLRDYHEYLDAIIKYITNHQPK